MESLVKSGLKKQDTSWQGKKVLVTGVGGFVGSMLANALLVRNAKVIGLLRDKLPVSNLKIANIEDKITIVDGELENYLLLYRIIHEYEISYIFHLGAQTLVDLARNNPLSTFESNIKGTWNLLEAARQSNIIKGIVVASSDKAYGVNEKLPYDESFCLLPTFPYDISKACADLLARGYAKTYNLSVAVLRPTNIYGPGDINLSRVIPDTIFALLNGREPVIRSNGLPLRDFLYIDDVISAYLSIGQEVTTPQVSGEAFNVGTNMPIKIIELVEKIITVSGKTNIKPRIVGTGVPLGEIENQFSNSDKIYRVIKWVPTISLEDGLQKTWDWWKSNWNILKNISN